MSTKRVVAGAALVASLGLMLPSSRVWAHHAFSAEFDANQPITLRGTVARVESINPYSWIHVDVKNPDGKVDRWMVEGGEPERAVAARLHEGFVAFRDRDCC